MPSIYLVNGQELVADSDEAAEQLWPGSWTNLRPCEALPASGVAVVTRRQALRALHAAGLLASVETAISSLPDPERTAARIDWDNATDFRRDFPLLVQLATALGLSSADIDDLFTAAAAIQ